MKTFFFFNRMGYRIEVKWHIGEEAMTAFLGLAIFFTIIGMFAAVLLFGEKIGVTSMKELFELGSFLATICTALIAGIALTGWRKEQRAEAISKQLCELHSAISRMSLQCTHTYLCATTGGVVMKIRNPYEGPVPERTEAMARENALHMQIEPEMHTAWAMAYHLKQTDIAEPYDAYCKTAGYFGLVGITIFDLTEIHKLHEQHKTQLEALSGALERQAVSMF